MIKIVFFAPYPGIFSDIKRAFDDRPDRDEFEYEIRQDIPNNPLENLEADIIIARGFTARSLQRALIPCTELQVSGYDIMAAVAKCRKIVPGCRRIALIGSFNMIYGSEAVNGILQDVSVTPYIIENETMLSETVEKARNEGNDAIVGTHSAVMQAERTGIPAVLIESGPEALTSAISHAKEAVLMSRRKQENSDRIANIMNYSFQGILSTDKDGIITMANSYVYSILKIDTSLIGVSLTEVFPDIPVEAVVKNGAKILSDLRRYHSMTLLVNCVPVAGEAGIAGCVLTFQNITQIHRQEDAIRKKLYRRELKARHHFPDYLAKSQEMKDMLRDAQEYSYADAHVMLLGETGTGKEMLAQSIHNESRRKNHAFVTVKCGMLSENALERELFGYAEGVIRGVSGEAAGAFELASQGTLFLDEAAELPLRIQARILRVLEEREVSRIGSRERLPVNVRIIASSGKDMETEIREGRFRRDLFYRLDVLELRIPPLREHPEDLPLLFSHNLALERQRHGGMVQRVGDAAMEILAAYPWPGNVREVENFCERLSVLCKRETARKEDVMRTLPALAEILKKRATEEESREDAGTAAEAAVTEGAGRMKADARSLEELLDRFGGSRKKAAEYLGIDPSTLWRRMKRAGIK